jgi:uncharacterized tellurite resistance protein B-like protein
MNKLSDFLSTMLLPASVEVREENTLQLAVAVLLIEVMQADAECAFEEQSAIMKILKQRFRLSDTEVVKLSERAQHASREANDFYRFTALINHELTLPEKIQIVEYLWQVVYADGKVSAHENHLMRKLVDLLHISLGDNAAAKERARAAAGVK